MQSHEWPIEAVHPNPRNPRHSIVNDPEFLGLVASIRSEGILQPLLINKEGLILAGHRRYEAALEIGLTKVPVKVLPDKNNHALVPLIENLQRKNLLAMEVADYLLECREVHRMNIPEMSAITGISVTTIGEYLKLAKAPEEIRGRLERDEITKCVALALCNRDEGFVKEVIDTPGLTRDIVRAKARERTRQPSTRVGVANSFAPKTTCPTERKAHLEYAIAAVRQLLAASPDDAFAVRYKRWIVTMEDDLADLEDRTEQTFRGAVNLFQRQPAAKAHSS
jgi:ParB/RepB/Spo0J family partition protein